MLYLAVITVPKHILLLFLVLIQTYPVYVLPSHFFKVNFNSILPSNFGSSKLVFPSDVSAKTFYVPLPSSTRVTSPAMV